METLIPKSDSLPQYCIFTLTLCSTQVPLDAFEMKDFWKYYEKWNIFKTIEM